MEKWILTGKLACQICFSLVRQGHHRGMRLVEYYSTFLVPK